MTTPAVLLSLLPALLVDLGGLGLALARWSRHPTASLLAALGLVLRLPASLSWVWLMRSELDGTSRALVSGGLGFVSQLGMALVVAAVFVGRAPAEAGAR